MNHPAIRSDPFATPLSRPLAQVIAAVARATGVLVAHVHETIGRGRSMSRSDDVAGMNARMLRDIGAESAIGPRAMATRDLQYPRL